ncbi:hypothetical protein [Coprococcus catus]|uniref:hypothetical protein n=1 Tax=Coprococcus catus TaxID=116085 RepID=UPI001C8B6B4D|nr:hypothetical protein [Coprococcus catus]MBX9229824.1 hypothetical protein [Coprococcus catus]MCT6800066.1 hypothetical protein [Coprococcus catus]
MSYWIVEFIKVLSGYIFLMYLWPSVIFRKKLSGKSLTFQFAFCSTVSILLSNTIILGLGLFHILNEGIVRWIYYGTFFLSIFKEKELRRYIFAHIKRTLSGTQGWKLLIFRQAESLKIIIVNSFQQLNKKIKGRRIEYGILFVLIVFAVAYFSYGAFQCHSYGWGDMYVHHAWIYGLKEGKIFSAGIYPEAMHCFIYCMNDLFGISVYSCMMFLGGIHVSALLLAIYCFLREVMKSKYTVYLVLAAFLTIDMVCVDEIYGMSRMQYTIPQEFGLYTQFLCALYLVRFLRRNPEEGKAKRKVWNDDLFLFMTSLAASLAIHFYVTMMAFFLCAAIAIFGIVKVFKKENFKSLVIAVLAGMIISAAPMVLAYASGIPLQGSLNWGMNVMNGTDTKEGRTQQAQSIASENNAETSSQNESESQSSESIQQESGVQSSQSVTSEEKQQTETNDALEQEQTSQKKSRKTIGEYIKMVYKYGYAQLYGDTRAKWLLGFTLIAGILSVINWIITAIRFRKLPFELYLGITAASVIFMILYAAPFLGLPEIIAGARLCLTEQVLLLSMMALPADEVLFAIGRRKMACILPYLSVLGVAVIYAGTNYFGVYHGYLYYELTRYNSVINLTNRIASEYPKQRYTIISTTDEIYQVIESGWHEEILDFYYKSKLEKYYIPTEYLFFYVEKNPIQYAQYHFFAGPRWLAQKKYSQYYKYSNAVISEGSAIKSSKISEDVLGEPLTDMGKASDAYSNLKNRTILESELYFWCQDFKARLPYEIQVYYEDEDVVCYMIKQNPEHLYNLGSK